MCRRGIARTFQLVRPFPALNVADNVIVGALLREKNVGAARERAFTVLRRLDLFDRTVFTDALELFERVLDVAARARFELVADFFERFLRRIDQARRVIAHFGLFAPGFVGGRLQLGVTDHAVNLVLGER